MKRGKSKFNFSNKILLISIVIVLIVSAGVYALGSVPNPGHEILDLQTCDSDGQILEMSGGNWVCSSGGSDSWISSGLDIYYPGGGRVGIGTSSPASILSVGTAGVSGAAIYGEGTTYGVYGKGVATSGSHYGVYGEASGSTGTDYAVFGKGGHTGVYGIADHYGVRGISNDVNGYGVHGSGDTGVRGVGNRRTGTNYGGSFIAWTSSGTNYGVYSEGGQYGVYGEGDEYGVYGKGGTYGVYASGTSADFYGETFRTVGNNVLCWDGSGASGIGDCTSLTILKKDIVNISRENLWEDIMELRPVNFHWKDNESDQRLQTGFLAEEVEAVNPLFADYAGIFNETTNETTSELQGVNWDGINSHLVAGVQELKMENEQQAEQIINQQYVISNLRNENYEQENSIKELTEENKAIKLFLCNSGINEFC